MEPHDDHTLHSGDWIEVEAPAGRPSRRGMILGVIGSGSHARYRVRWDEAHESILYPTAGVRLLHRAGARKGRASAATAP